MKNPLYPLEQVAMIKAKRLDEAEKILKQKKEVLKEEDRKLDVAKKKFEKVRQHKADKLYAFQKELDEGTTSDKIEIHERYIKNVVNEELKIEKHKVSQQQKIVKASEEAVEIARKDRLQKNQDVEKLRLHRKEWEKEMRVEMARHENSENDELGSNMHELRRKQKGRGKR